MKIHLVLASLLVFCVDANAGSTRYDALTERLIAIKREIDMPAGVAVAIVQGPDLVYEGYAGFSAVETAVPVDAKTHFYIASTTKAFLSLAVLLAEHRGEVKESTTLRQLFPQTAFPSIEPSRHGQAPADTYLRARQSSLHLGGILLRAARCGATPEVRVVDLSR